MIYVQDRRVGYLGTKSQFETRPVQSTLSSLFCTSYTYNTGYQSNPIDNSAYKGRIAALLLKARSQSCYTYLPRSILIDLASDRPPPQSP